jgi:hypothetical protein
MASSAREKFDKNCQDIDRLMEIHKHYAGNDPGRKMQLEVLNKSAIVLISAFWEAYCEDVVSEGLKHIIEHSENSTTLPTDLKKKIAVELKKDPHDLAVWKLADSAWRDYLKARLDKLNDDRAKNLNTPKSSKIQALFDDTIAISDITAKWRWRKMSSSNAQKKLDKFVSLRGTIAHRGSNETHSYKYEVTDFLNHVKKLVEITDDDVNGHILKLTGKKMW